MLEGVHGARVHVDVRVKLLDGAGHAPRLEQGPDGRPPPAPCPGDESTPPVMKMNFGLEPRLPLPQFLDGDARQCETDPLKM